MITLLAPGTPKPGSNRDRALRGLDRLPPLSPVVGRLLAKLAFKSVDFRELTALVGKDALLCGHILKTVNSAGFARSRTITSVQQAMSLLGIGQLRRIAVGFAVGNIFSKVRTPASWSRQRFNLHSGATALLTEGMVEKLSLDTKDGAFVAGMLHDLGKLLIAVTLSDSYETIAAMVCVSERSALDCEIDVLGIGHAELSALALSKWGLPELVCQAVYHHHTPEALHAPRLAAVIERADRFVNHLGITVLPPSAHESEPPSIEIPGLEFDTAAVLQRFETEWLELASFFE
jgi:HD-like signal output (HDOD) protein